MFAALPEQARDRLTLRLRLVHANPGDHAPIHAWVLDGTTRLDVGVSPDGVMPVTANQDWIARDLQMQTDQPKGSLTVKFDLLIRPPGGQQVSVSYLLAGARQAQAAIIAAARQYGGYLATFAAPTVSRIDLTLAGCCNGTARLGAGPGGATLTQSSAGKVLLALKLLSAHPDSVVETSAPIVEIEPGD